MRKLIIVAVVGLVCSSGVALAKERNVQLLAPASPTAGKAWHARISVKMDGKLAPGKSPTVRIISAAGRTINVRARPTPANGLYRALVVFPRAGMWRVLVIDRETGRAYEFGRVRVRT